MENEMLEFGSLGIGKEQPPIVPKKVLVVDFKESEVKDTSGKDLGKKLVLKVKHPDVTEIELSKVKYEKKGALKESGLWLTKDKDGNIAYNSAVAQLLRFYHCDTIMDLVKRELDTTIDQNGFIIVKAY